MTKKLVIVESPSKGRTISRFLGSDFVVESSYGHIRDLPRSKLGVDIEHDFQPQYVIPQKARAAVKKLKAAAAKAEKTILATDEDREGESIAWHLKEALGLDESQIERIAFHEITKRAIEEALAHPRTIDIPLVDAQQARRILDRLVGYKLSPFLWSKIYRGLSAGRVQSVAVRLIVEREREIQQFKPQEYWSISALLRKLQIPNEFEAFSIKTDGKTLDKFAVPNREEAEKIVNDLEGASWMVENVEKKAAAKNPPTPFTTSTLQQDAFRRLGFSAKQTMMLAQQLYEGVELGDEGSTGLITYMRTDSVNLSEDAMREAASLIKKSLGNAYALPAPRRFTTKTKGAQEAHEAIRPTDPWRTPESVQPFLDRRQFRLYHLIWRRFLATQMPQAVFDTTTVDIAASKTANTQYTFRANGQIMRFDGFLKVYPIQFTESALPELTPQDPLDLVKLDQLQHFTQPPPRFTEASLVKILEQHGIGRPSTYAPIISTIQDRGYVERHERRYLKPTEIGIVVNDLLVAHFPEVVDVQFTAKMEEELDDIASGKMQWQPVVKEFYEPFAKRLAEKYEEVQKRHAPEETGEACPQCGKPLMMRMSRFGKFIACSGFPECTYKRSDPENKKAPPETINMRCPKCKEGQLVIRRTRRGGKPFFGCGHYPKCDYASWDDPRNTENKSTNAGDGRDGQDTSP